MDLPMLSDFKNEPYIDFSLVENQEALRKAMEGVNKRLGKTYPLIINGKKLFEGETQTIKNPANTDEKIGNAHLATKEHAELAIKSAEHAFETWQDVPYYECAAKLLKAAQLARERKLELSIWLSKENGKSIREAVAEVAEGIDFMDYYARRMNEIGSQPAQLVHVQGEKNKLLYIPLGIGVIIAPWNFPFAILAGMATAALVTGNTVVVKPSSVTPIMAYHVFEILEQAGFAPGVANYLPGASSEIGNYLVEHPKTRFISFTGSTAVGKDIYEKAARFATGQHWFKRMILETGGKNHVIVCEDADIDKAARGVMRSAFGYSGQKCSACSVALVDKKIYEPFIKKLKEETEKLKIGEGTDADNFTGPLASEEQMQKVQKYLEIAKKEGKIIIGGERLSEGKYAKGYFIKPTIVTNAREDAKIVREEIFGPVLVVDKINSFEEALARQRSSDYGLTGGLFTKDPKRKEMAMRKFHAGNFYINKETGASTGAYVGRQPFGGFNMSGTDSKAGGPNYLYLYLQEKSITEFD